MHLIVSVIEKYGLVAVFCNALLEGLGLPLPCYPILMIAAAMVPQMHYSLIDIIAVAAVAELCADSAWFWAGRRFGTRIVKSLCRISLSPDSCVHNTNAMFVRVGPFSLTFAKFIPGFSTVGIVLASAMRIPLRSVVFFDVLGVLIYTSIGVMLGSLFHDAISDTLTALTTLGREGLLIVVAAFGLFILGKWLQRKHFIHQLKMNRITASELKDLIDEGLEPIILDVRPRVVREKEGFIPGSIFAHETDFKSIVSRFPRHSEVIVYCNCPNEASAVILAKKLQKAGFKKIRPLLGGMDAWTKAGPSPYPVSLAA